MAEAILAPDALQLALNYLAAARVQAGDSVTHFGGKVASQYDRQVVGTLTDTEQHNLVVFRSTLRFDCYSEETLGRQEAHDLGQWSRALLGFMAGTVQAGTTVYRVLDGSPGVNDSPDELSGHNRFTFYVVLSLRGVAMSEEMVLTTETGAPLVVI